MIVIVAGMPRSGSTFSFNIVRECLLARGTVQWESSNCLPSAEQLSATDHFILKSHNPQPDVLAMVEAGGAQAVCTYRKPEDAVASMAAVFAMCIPDAIRSVCSWLEWHRQRQWPCGIAYDRIEDDPLSVIADISSHLQCEVDGTELERLMASYDKRSTFERVSQMEPSAATVDIGFSYYDRQSFFHRRHVRSVKPLAAADTLSDADLHLVRETLAPFVRANGQYVPP